MNDEPGMWKTVFHYSDPDLCWETNEFIVEESTIDGRLRYGHDGGCSCYEGFDPSNFVVTYWAPDVRQAFAGWVGGLKDPARAWERYLEAMHNNRCPA